MELCGCSVTCGDDRDIDGPGTCKGLPVPPREPLVEVAEAAQALPEDVFSAVTHAERAAVTRFAAALAGLGITAERCSNWYCQDGWVERGDNESGGAPPYPCGVCRRHLPAGITAEETQA